MGVSVMSADLREFALQVLEIAKDNLRQYSQLLPVCFLITEGRADIMPVVFQTPEEKAAAYREVVAAARQRGAMAIITLNDAHYQRNPTSADTDGYYPGKLAAEGAPECILLTVCGPAMPSWEIQVPYTRSEGGLTFGEPEESTGPHLTFLEGWASDTVPPPS
jgi:hypothetical protein